jgi:uncharacterized membrane protein YfcA
MEYFVICLAALLGSALTLFSGFGLGTLLVPVFGIFFPIEIAIALTAIVHFLNNLFKLALLGRRADGSTVIRFGIPSIIAALAGAYLLSRISHYEPLGSYMLGGNVFEVSPVKLVVGVLLVAFALFELLPRLKNLSFDRRYLVPGGLLSGFFGGLSGHQGALRSAFLIRSGLSKERFIATGIVIAVMTDISRLAVYSKQIIADAANISYALLLAATLSAFAGAFAGNKVLKKVTIRTVQHIVAAMLLLFALLLGSGII